MTAPEIELLVLDGQGVVFTDPLAAFFDRIADATGQERHAVQARWRDDIRELAWRGEIEDDAVWRALAGSDAGGWGVLLEAAYGTGPAAPRLATWAARVPIWLLTNHRTAWVERRLERFDLRRWLSRILVSDALGALKPQRAVFAPILAHVRDPSTVLLVDDQAKNVAAAAELGLTALLADSAESWISAVDQRLGTAPQFDQ